MMKKVCILCINQLEGETLILSEMRMKMNKRLSSFDHFYLITVNQNKIISFV